MVRNQDDSELSWADHVLVTEAERQHSNPDLIVAVETGRGCNFGHWTLCMLTCFTLAILISCVPSVYTAKVLLKKEAKSMWSLFRDRPYYVTKANTVL